MCFMELFSKCIVGGCYRTSADRSDIFRQFLKNRPAAGGGTGVRRTHQICQKVHF